MKKAGRIRKLLLPYIVCIFFPILAAVILGRILINNYFDNMLSDKMMTIENSFEDYQEKLIEIENIVYYINNLSEITQYTYNALNNKKNSLELDKNIMDQLEVFCTNEEIVEIYLYDRMNNRIIASGSTLNDAARFFRFYYQIEGYTPDENVERLNKMSTSLRQYPVMTGMVRGSRSGLLECSMQVPAKMSRFYSLQLVVSVNADLLFNELYEFCGENGEFYIYGHEEQLLFSNGSKYENLLPMKQQELLKLEYQNQQVYGAVLHAADGSCKLKVYIQQKPWLNSIHRKSWYIIWIMTISFLISITFCIYFTVRKFREIQDILGMFDFDSALDTRLYDYQIIKNNIKRLIDEKKQIYEKINEWEKKWFLNQLIYSENEAPDMRTEDLHIRDGRNFVFCVRYEDEDLQKIGGEFVLRDIMERYIKDTFGDDVEIFDSTARECIAVVYSEDSGKMDTVGKEALKLSKDILLTHDIMLVMGIGDLVNSIYELGKSYRQAKEVIQYNKDSGKKILMYSELQQLGKWQKNSEEIDKKFMPDNEIDDYIAIQMMIYIKNNYTNSSLSMDKIADEIGFHKDSLRRKFKAEYGVNPSWLIEKFRIEDACELLENTKISIDDIATCVGYNSTVAFRRAYKKVMGITPIEYRSVCLKSKVQIRGEY